MGRLNIQNINGVPPYEVYVSDQYGNNKNLIATINSNVPPTQYFFLPDIFDGIDRIMLTINDSSGCDYCNFFKIIDCRFGCQFDVIIQASGCQFSLNIDKKTCEVNNITII
jgi:hypothetical protein